LRAQAKQSSTATRFWIASALARLAMTFSIVIARLAAFAGDDKRRF
jgi:hypothetical protein